MMLYKGSRADAFAVLYGMDYNSFLQVLLLLSVSKLSATFNNCTSTIDGCSANCALPVARNLRLTYTGQDGNFSATLMWDVAPLPSTGPQSYCKGLYRWMTRVVTYPTYLMLPNDFQNVDSSVSWRDLDACDQSADYIDLNDRTYYLFQIKHNFLCSNSRPAQTTSSYLYYFGYQAAPVVTTPTHWISVVEGSDVTLECTAVGAPAPMFTWVIDLTTTPTTPPQNDEHTVIVNGQHPIKAATSNDQKRYWCIAKSISVNPPLGKRPMIDMTYVDLIVTARTNTSICKSDGLNSVLSLCYPYLSSGQTSIFYNQTYPPNSAALPSYFNTIGMLAQNMSDCADIAKELLCFSMFPYCDPTSSEPRPLPVCSQTCNAFTQGQCGALFNSSDLYTLMMSNCGLSTPVAGNLPECIMSSKLSGTTNKTGSCMSGNGRGYQGGIGVTVSGLPCQQWSVQAPQKHIITPSTYVDDLKDSSVYCRNPGGLGERPWCYTTDLRTRWEYCNIPQCETCDLYSGSFCSGFGFNTVYVNREIFPNGQVDIESSLQNVYNKLITQNKVPLTDGCSTILHMFLCQRSFPTCAAGNVPMVLCHDQCSLLSVVTMCLGQALAGQLVGGAGLQCDQNRATNPHCLPLPSWGQFEVELSDSEDGCYSNNGATYNGTVAASQSGSTCLQWSNSTYMTNLFPGLMGSKNYCRNPGGLGTGPWCFTASGKMEYCSVSQCKGGTQQQKAQTDVAQETVAGGGGGTNAGAVIAVVSIAGMVVIVVVIVGVIGTVHCYKQQARKAHFLIQLQKQESRKDLSLQYNPHYFTQTIVPARLQPAIDTFPKLDRSKVQYVKELGKGNFGVVFLGKVDRLKEGEGEVMVAVKTLREETSEALENFVSEAKTMFAFDHPNIVKIHAVCMKEVPYYMVFEYMDKGDLAHFLQENASSSQKRKNPFGVHERTESSLSNNPPQLCCEQLADMCRQIASGMDYLSKKNHIHRDLACRNCLVSSPLNIKIGDFGMSQKLYTRDYYRVNGKAVLPIRWMSPEAVVYGKFTTQSDVWSFGVVMWEVWSFAMQPYYGVTNEEVTQLVRKGKHLDVPADCPEKIYEIMTECWSMDPACRPTFSELHDMLANYHFSTSTDEDHNGGRGLNDSASLNSDVFSETGSYDDDLAA